ncbi:MAG: T9SS type A sorting domain-containing protein [Bacteroidota bacterium]
MRNKIQVLQNGILCGVLFCLSAFFHFLAAQSHTVCADADPATVKATCQFNNYFFDAASQEYWIKFTATDTIITVKADTNIYDPAHLHDIKLYSGNCTSLTLIDSIDAEDTLQFSVNNLIYGQDYYILIKRGDPLICTKPGCSYGVKNFRLCIRGGGQPVSFCVTHPNGTTECCNSDSGQNNFLLESFTNGACISQICTNTPICAAINANGMTNFDPNYQTNVTVSAPGSVFAPPAGYPLDDYYVSNNCFPLLYPVQGVYPVTFSFFDQISGTTVSYTTWIHVVDADPDFTAVLNGNRFCDWDELCSNFGVTFNDTTTHIYISIDNLPTFPDALPTQSSLLNYCTPSSDPGLCPGDHELIVIGCSPSRFNFFVPEENCACDTLRFPFRLGPFPEFETQIDCDTLHINNLSQCQGQITNDFSWVWNMGDGNTFTGFTPPGDYVYEFAGEYIVSLTMIFFYPGCDSSITTYDTINVGKPIELEIEGPLNTCCDTVTYFCANCVGDVTWEFFTDSIISYFTSGNPVTFVWPAGSNGIAFEVTFTDSVGCVSDTTIALEACCTPIDPLPMGALETGYCNDTIYSSQFFAPYLTGPNEVAGYYIVLQSDLIVDANIDFRLCQIRVAPGRKIIVEDGITLRIRETKVKALCTEMWDGIYADNSLSHIFVSGGLSPNPNDDSEIWDAINGIVSTNGAKFTIQDSKLNNNYISVQALNFNGIHPGQMNTTSIQTTNANLYSPHAGERMKYGVKIANVKGITIGISYNNVNEFSNMDYGVYATESSVTLFGNRFQGIRRPNNIAPCPTCIDPIGTAVFLRSKFAPVTLTLGDNTNANRNEFNQCYIGAKVYDNVNMRAQRNTLKNIEEAGLFMHFNAGKTHVIRNNTIQFTKIGIHGLDVGNCNFTINLNSINNSNTSCPGNCIDNTAILIENTFQSNITANIFNNIIDRKRVGIWVRNVVSPQPWPNNSVKVFGNTVNFGALNNNVVPFYYGVRVDNSRNILVQDEHVYKLGANPSVNVFQSIRGIRLINSQGCTVTKNLIEKCGAGISAFGNCVNANLECNNLDKNFYGFTFEGPAGTASVGTQVVGNLPTGNTWNTLSGGFDLHGGIFPQISWYYPVNGYSPVHDLASGSLTNSNNPLASPLSDRCSSFFSPAPPDDREARLGKIVRDENVYNNNENEFKLFDKKYAHKELSDNTNLLLLGVPDDIDYQNFFSAEQNSNIGMFNMVENYLFNRQFAQAFQLLSGISPQNTWEYNLKRAYEIAPYFLADSLTPSNAMTLELEDIAFQNSLTGGPGVTAARVMLQLDIEDEVNEPRNSISETGDSKKVLNHVNIYPNPANNKFTAAFEENIENAVLNLVDVTGKTVKTMNILEQKSVEVDISTLSSGVYFIELQIDDTVIFREKLIKSK